MENSNENLKHLGFVRVAAINTIVWLSNVYENAKNNCGSLRSTVGSVENAVTSVITPLCSNFKDVPDHLLVFLDQKVDVVSAKFNEQAPPLVKQVAIQVHGLVEKTVQVTKELVHQTQVGGPFEAARYAASESKEVVLNQSVKLWAKLDQISPFHMMVEMTVPTAAHFSKKYNELISNLRGKGYTAFYYAPLVPLNEIAKAFKQSRDVNKEETEVTSQ